MDKGLKSINIPYFLHFIYAQGSIPLKVFTYRRVHNIKELDYKDKLGNPRSLKLLKQLSFLNSVNSPLNFRPSRFAFRMVFLRYALQQ